MSEEDGGDAKNQTGNCWGEENLCPNKGGKGRKKGGAKLLRSKGSSTQAQGTAAKGRPESGARTQGRRSNAPTHSSEFDAVCVGSVAFVQPPLDGEFGSSVK